jgi:aspartate aminotransferase/aminotransferase
LSTPDRWIADRMGAIEGSKVRKVFELARSLSDPVNLSIGQPDFDVPAPIKHALKEAVDAGRNGYTLTQGVPELREKLKAMVSARFPHVDRDLVVTSGTSGALNLVLAATVNPGDEVILFDPFFVSYPHLVTLAGGVPVYVDTYPDFGLDIDRVQAAITPRTKAIMFCSPSNPTGAIPPPDAVRDLARLAARRGILLVSDEIYNAFSYDGTFRTPAEDNEDVLVVDGFSKTYGITGWRLGFAHGPKRLIEEMSKLQQYTYVCPPSMVQHAALAALDFDMTPYIEAYRRKRDSLAGALRGRYSFVVPGGAFYLFPKTPARFPDATKFVEECIRNQLLVIPGSAFSRRDSHFRISFAASDAQLARGAEILRSIANG